VVDAEIHVREDKVYLAKRCREHGGFEALLYSDPELHFESIGIIEVHTAGNLDWPVCFADSGHHADGFSLAWTKSKGDLTRSWRPKGDKRWFMFSGGEPSIHPQILEVCASALEKGVKTVVLNTNGIRLAHDRRSAPSLAEPGVRI
jgi:uncharacterized radical SAM superfamily Fe-S cluster-containing enzyme